MNRSPDSRSSLHQGIIRLSLTIRRNMEDRVPDMEEDIREGRVDMGSRAVGMEVLHNTRVRQEVTEASKVGSMVDTKEVSMVGHQVAIHRKEETREDIQVIRAVTQDTSLLPSKD